MIKSMVLGLGVMLGLIGFALVIGDAAGEAGASVIIGVLFGVFAAVPVALAIALADRHRRERPRRYETHVHQHDNRQVVVYIQRPDGSLELLETMDARQIAAATNGKHLEVKR